MTYQTHKGGLEYEMKNDGCNEQGVAVTREVALEGIIT